MPRKQKKQKQTQRQDNRKLLAVIGLAVLVILTGSAMNIMGDKTVVTVAPGENVDISLTYTLKNGYWDSGTYGQVYFRQLNVGANKKLIWTTPVLQPGESVENVHTFKAPSSEGTYEFRYYASTGISSSDSYGRHDLVVHVQELSEQPLDDPVEPIVKPIVKPIVLTGSTGFWSQLVSLYASVLDYLLGLFSGPSEMQLYQVHDYGQVYNSTNRSI